jgi:dethiobiotin synthetase
MARKPARGLFITGTDTGIGKTYVAALVARALVAGGHRVGVYKPAASGCSDYGNGPVSDDALTLWQAAGSPGTLAEVCPQVFAAPLAPHLAAAAEGRRLDAALLRRGLEVWLERSEIVLIEGAGGLMSPLGADEYVADLAYDFGFPLLVVARNGLGVINHVLQTLITAATFRDGLSVAGIVLNEAVPPAGDVSIEHNAREIRGRAVPPVLAEVGYGADRFDPSVDWFAVSAEALPPAGPVEDGTP